MKQQDRWSILGSRLTVKNVEAINCGGFVKRRVRDRTDVPAPPVPSTSGACCEQAPAIATTVRLIDMTANRATIAL